MKVLWLCGLPQEVQQQALQGEDHGADAAWSWIVSHLPPPSGIELHVACRTSRRGEYRTFNFRGAQFHLIPVKARGRAYSLFSFDWRSYGAVVQRIQPELIHGWGTEDAYANVALHFARTSHLVQIQGCVNACRARARMPLVTWFAALNERRILARARHVVAENNYALGLAKPLICTSSLHVVEHPVRAEFLAAKPTTSDARQALFVGAIEERKGIFDAVEAFRRAAPTDWRLLIVGDGPEATINKLRAQLGSPGFAGRIIHERALTPGDIVERMQASSVFLLPTWIDTGPTTLKEALVLGLWPVCYDNSGPAHYLKRFACGTLAEDRNLASLAEALQHTISTRPFAHAAFREKVESVIRPEFNPNRIWKELAGLYQFVIGQGNSASDRHSA